MVSETNVVPTKTKVGYTGFNKFKGMLDDLSKLIRELRKITSSIADLRRQREIFVDQMFACTDVDELEIIEDALSAEESALSNPASKLRIALTETATTVRLFLFPFSRLYLTVVEDMETHAGSDDDAESVEGHGADSSDGESTLLQDNQISLAKLTDHDHQNNLSESQKEDREQNFRLGSQYINRCSEMGEAKRLNAFRYLKSREATTLIPFEGSRNTVHQAWISRRCRGVRTPIGMEYPIPALHPLTSRIVLLGRFRRRYV